ncbi:hypothetical protein Q8A73_017888 [Channa argus]|nr:hypothetical protein Q8A73_017888 [Channa argus]
MRSLSRALASPHLTSHRAANPLIPFRLELWVLVAICGVQESHCTLSPIDCTSLPAAFVHVLHTKTAQGNWLLPTQAQREASLCWSSFDGNEPVGQITCEKMFLLECKPHLDDNLTEKRFRIDGWTPKDSTDARRGGAPKSDLPLAAAALSRRRAARRRQRQLEEASRTGEEREERGGEGLKCDFILKVRTCNSSCVPGLSALTAAPRCSYFTGSHRRRATSPTWLIRGDVTQRPAGEQRGAGFCASPSPSQDTGPAARHDERTPEVWTLRTAARSGERDLVEKLAFSSCGARAGDARREVVKGDFRLLLFSTVAKTALRRTRTCGF